jgi:hypothetical protein
MGTARSKKKACNAGEKPSGRKVDITEKEKEVIIHACTKYKQSIPIYLKSRQWEIAVINSIIKKMSG